MWRHAYVVKKRSGKYEKCLMQTYCSYYYKKDSSNGWYWSKLHLDFIYHKPISTSNHTIVCYPLRRSRLHSICMLRKWLTRTKVTVLKTECILDCGFKSRDLKLVNQLHSKIRLEVTWVYLVISIMLPCEFT